MRTVCPDSSPKQLWLLAGVCGLAAMISLSAPAPVAAAKAVPNTISENPVPEYQHASPAAYEAFRDLKYGIRIHWGIYTLAREKIAPSNDGESWMFLPLTFQQKQAYQQLYKQWNPTRFDADAWATLFADNGMKMFAITTKHHEGFSLFDTQTRVAERVNWTAPQGPALEKCDLSYSVMETPFHRDIIKELCDAGHRHGLAIDLYFSHTDWYDADFRPYGRDPVYFPGSGHNDKLDNPRYLFANAPPPTAEEQNRMMLRHRRQLTELLTHYGKIDMLCLDIGLGNAVWPQMRQTILDLRKLQPDVMLRDRGIGQYGDYDTPERVIPGSKNAPALPWFVIYPLAKNFDYDANPADYKGGPWIVRSLVDTVAKGGNFMVGVGPDADGTFHPQAVADIQLAGAWLKTNGQGIYATRPRPGDLWHERDVRFTQSKDHHTIYAFALHWPGDTLTLKTVRPKPGSEVYLMGYPSPLTWHDSGAGTVIHMPEDLRDPANRSGYFVSGLTMEPQNPE